MVLKTVPTFYLNAIILFNFKETRPIIKEEHFQINDIELQRIVTQTVYFFREKVK